MKLTCIVINNFLSIDEIEHEFKDGITGIYGQNRDAQNMDANGCGKSALFDAIVWALYGKTLRNIANDDVIRRGKKSAIVTLGFSLPSGEYVVTRDRGPKSSLQLQKVEGNDYKDLSHATLTQTQAKIESLIGMDYQTFVLSTTFGADGLRFAGASDKEQKETLETLADVMIYAAGLDKVRNELKAANTKKDSLQSKRNALQMTLSNAKKSLEQAQIRRQDAEKNLSTRKAFAESCAVSRGVRIAKHESDIATKSSEKKQLEAELSSLSSPPGDDLNAINSAVLKAQAEVSGIASSLRHNTDATTTQKLILSDLNSKIGKPCVSCTRPITINELQGVKLAAEKAIAELQAEAERLTEAKRIADAALSDQKARYETARKEQQGWHEDTAAARGLINKLNSEIAEAIYDIKIARMEEKASEDELKITVDDLLKWRGIEENLAADVSRLFGEEQAVSIELVRVAEELEYLTFWERGFGTAGIRSMLMDSLGARLTEATNDNLNQLTGGTVRVEISPVTLLKSGEARDKLDIKIFNRFGAGVYEGNSGGEKQRIDLCLALALHEIASTRAGINGPRFLLLDEVFERIDSSGADAFLSLLAKKGYPMVYVIAHNPNYSARFDRIFTVVKQDGISYINGALCDESKQMSS